VLVVELRLRVSRYTLIAHLWGHFQIVLSV
jgi:hypothetical protein